MPMGYAQCSCYLCKPHKKDVNGRWLTRQEIIHKEQLNAEDENDPRGY